MSVFDDMTPELALKVAKTARIAVRVAVGVAVVSLVLVPWLWVVGVVSGRVCLAALVTGLVALLITVAYTTLFMEALKKIQAPRPGCTCPQVTNGLGRRVTYRDPHCPTHRTVGAA